MYIYESHLGGLFTSEEFLDYDELYCEECGDCDNFVGSANTLSEAWELLKGMVDTFDDSICKKCEHIDDYDYCDGNCEAYSNSGGYDYNYVCRFLYENFKVEEKDYYILISKHVGENGMVFVNCKPSGCKFGEKYMIPITVGLRDTFTNEFKVRPLLNYLDAYRDGSLREVITKNVDGDNYTIFACEAKEEGNDWRESAHYVDNGWYGYVKIEDVVKNFYDKKVLDVIRDVLEE